MFSIIGIVVVIGAVIGGYLMEKGNLMVLVQPAELVIIGGAAIGTLLIANPLPVVIKIFTGILGILGGSKFSKAITSKLCACSSTSLTLPAKQAWPSSKPI